MLVYWPWCLCVTVFDCLCMWISLFLSLIPPPVSQTMCLLNMTYFWLATLSPLCFGKSDLSVYLCLPLCLGTHPSACLWLSFQHIHYTCCFSKQCWRTPRPNGLRQLLQNLHTTNSAPNPQWPLPSWSFFTSKQNISQGHLTPHHLNNRRYYPTPTQPVNLENPLIKHKQTNERPLSRPVLIVYKNASQHMH